MRLLGRLSGRALHICCPDDVILASLEEMRCLCTKDKIIFYETKAKTVWSVHIADSAQGSDSGSATPTLIVS